MRSFTRYLTVVVAVSVTLAGCTNGSPGPVSKEGASPHPEWSYKGPDGPENWGKLDSSFTKCSQGTEQSPIDILSSANASGNATIGVNYVAGGTSITNNGHTIQAEATGTNNLTVNGTKYDLVQMHFHAPSEHTIGGVNAPVEFHFVNKASDGSLAVVAVLARVGAENEAARPFVEAAKLGKGETTSSPQVIGWPSLLPKVLDRYVYQGSLTTPPCTEGVKWVVLTTPVDFSAEQIALLQKAYLGNNRPVQPLGSREISHSVL